MISPSNLIPRFQHPDKPCLALSGVANMGLPKTMIKTRSPAADALPSLRRTTILCFCSAVLLVELEPPIAIRYLSSALGRANWGSSNVPALGLSSSPGIGIVVNSTRTRPPPFRFLTIYGVLDISEGANLATSSANFLEGEPPPSRKEVLRHGAQPPISPSDLVSFFFFFFFGFDVPIPSIPSLSLNFLTARLTGRGSAQERGSLKCARIEALGSTRAGPTNPTTNVPELGGVRGEDRQN
ncbi:hypothetical protein B0H19DRAFT_1074921 [Mycena capillaripes]|nr:hypothetical protein B0H19DRAFT_1074921 [Mycena capillaripes]